MVFLYSVSSNLVFVISEYNSMEVERPPLCSPWGICYPRLIFRLRGTVLIKIWPQCVLIVLYTSGVVSAHNYVDHLRMNFPMYLVTILGTVTGLLLVFRTNTAYDRYWEGRKIWGTMTYHLRSLSLNIWVGMSKTIEKPEEGATSASDTADTIDLIERVSALNLLIGFACAVKNYLRGDYEYDCKDLKCIRHLPRFQLPQCSYSSKSKNTESEQVENPTVNIPMLSTSEKESEVAKTKQKKSGDHTRHRRLKKNYRIKAYDIKPPSNIPIEIAYYLFSYLKTVGIRGGCEANVLRNSQSSALVLIDCLTQFERILRTPMPLAYSIHLQCTLWIYLLALPYQLVGNLNWWTIPAVALAAFALLGILAIGGEIENPFGYDENDLPLDEYCDVIRHEIEMLVANPVPPTSSWMLSEENYPFAPRSWLNSKELASKSVVELGDILARVKRTTFQKDFHTELADSSQL